MLGPLSLWREVMPRFLGPTPVGSEPAWRVCLDTWFSASSGLRVEGGSARATWVPPQLGSR